MRFHLAASYGISRNADGYERAAWLSTAMDGQLGLKLEPVEAVAALMVVDQVSRPGAK